MLDQKPDALTADIRAARIAEQVLAMEGRFLDLQDWDAWLDLYAPDCTYWVPIWMDEDTATTDPQSQMSLIYHTSRTGLEERVLRIRTRKSVTAMPLPRTVHMVSNILVVSQSDTEIEGTAAWNVQHYDPRVGKRTSNCGHYEFTLANTAGGWKIARKKVILLDDMLPAVIDFYGL
ncbi:aromatic-ring-hydroxylating dioxygenase subunit beta [Pseudoruegeria sp. HB172150]|uniref:aromatic-ring-hydroxylating dioxygenase subunit beta n=1 Tax=Pseudoruegeria sp. HB172150 TaxID=2721164 RepID=UPI001551B99F|nr:aromatic-ring-hydroxylating dioxygenase subunit beta [Pseudoruegeria sp. HB172150]